MGKGKKKMSINGTDSDVQLQREMGLFSAVNIILGVMIGSGIFISTASSLENAGSVGMCIIVWIVCGLISLLGALTFAELGAVVPRSGAEYAYFMDSFGPLHPFWGKLPAFLLSWIYVIALRPAEVAVIVFTFSEYVCQPLFVLIGIYDPEYASKITKLLSLLTLGIITFINATSVKLYVKLQNIFSVCKVLACLIVIIGGLYQICRGKVEYLNSGFEGTKLAPKNIALAFYSGLWAYDGWNTVTTVTEEIRNPEKNILRSLAISVPLVTLLYVFMNVSYLAVLTVPEIIEAPAIAVLFGDRILGPFRFLIPIGVAIATFGCALSLQFSVTRVCYVAGQDGHALECLSYIHYTRLTPVIAVALQGFISLIYVLIGNVTELIQFASFFIWVSYGTAMVSLLILRKTMKNKRRPYKAPIWTVILVMFVAIFLSITPIVTDPSPKYLFAIGFMLVGVVIYYFFVYKQNRPKIIDNITFLLQVLFEVVPTEVRQDKL